MERYFTFRYEPFEDVADDDCMLAMLKDNKVYDFIPNVQSWVNVETIQQDFYTNDPAAEFTEIDAVKAHEIAKEMRPYNPLIIRIILEGVPKDGIIPFEETI